MPFLASIFLLISACLCCCNSSCCDCNFLAALLRSSTCLSSSSLFLRCSASICKNSCFKKLSNNYQEVISISSSASSEQAVSCNIQQGYHLFYFCYLSLLTLLVPILTNINFLPTISRDCQEQSLWELINWLQRDQSLIFYQILSTNFFKEMYGHQSGEFVCRYWGLKD